MRRCVIVHDKAGSVRGSERSRPRISCHCLEDREGVRNQRNLTHDLLDTCEEGEGVENAVKKLGLEARRSSCYICFATLQGEVLIEYKPKKEETQAELKVYDMRNDLR